MAFLIIGETWTAHDSVRGRRRERSSYGCERRRRWIIESCHGLTAALAAPTLKNDDVPRAGWRRNQTCAMRRRFAAVAAFHSLSRLRMLMGAARTHCPRAFRVSQLSWHSTTPTLAMRLSCNFMNVNTIAYRVQHMCTRVHARTHPLRTSSRGSSLGKSRGVSDKSARIVVRVRLVASWTEKSPDTPTSSRRSSRGSRRGCPCRCRCPYPCRSRGIPALLVLKKPAGRRYILYVY